MAFVWTTLSTVAALKIIPSQMTPAGWLDAIYPAVLAGLLSAFGTFVVQTDPARRLLGRM
jgi:hypothetical protein